MKNTKKLREKLAVKLKYSPPNYEHRSLIPPNIRYLAVDTADGIPGNEPAQHHRRAGGGGWMYSCNSEAGKKNRESDPTELNRFVILCFFGFMCSSFSKK